MAEIPKLTEAEADFLRAASHLRGDGDFDHIVDFRDNRGLTRWDSSPADGPCLTDLGRAALAAYDAEQRRRIRVEAMRECIVAAMTVQSQSEADGEEDDDVFDLAQERAYGAKLVIRAIADLIAKEESNG